MTGRTESGIKEILDRKRLRRMAGAQSFARGEDYFSDGQVGSIVEQQRTIAAKVQGTRLYRVELWVEDGQLGYSCTCPVGVEGAFCKHCVALGLEWLEQQSPAEGASKQSAKPSVTMEEVRAYLGAQEKGTLVDMLLEQAMEDDRLRQRLLMKAANRGPAGLHLGTYRQAFDDAVNPRRFVRYGEMYDYVQGIEDAIDSVEDLLKEGHAAEVVALAEHALAALEKAMQSVDDSDGDMTGLRERLEGLHLEACQKAKPDPEELASRLFGWELSTDYDTFFGAADTYAKVLGKKGLALYRKLAEAQWAHVPTLGPGARGSEEFGSRFRITHIMETLARQTGDVEAIVAVKKRDLSCEYSFLQIAEAYKQARKGDLALEWAERGLKAFPERTDSRLREFLAAEYHKRKRHHDAMDLIWAGFGESPRLDKYQNLKSHADRARQWTAWREKALAYLRQRIENAMAEAEAQKNRLAWFRRADHSELVRILLWEKDVEAAWREAKEGGCSNELWLELAAKREIDHPEDALPIYQAQIEPTLHQKNNEAYRSAINFLQKVRALMARLGQEAEFAPYLAAVRAAHRPKRNFMKLIEGAKWQ